MCTILFAHKVHPKYPLIVLANRDEAYARPTKSMHWWEGGNILAGKDLKAGGTWLGVSKTGKIGIITNYRDGFEEQKDAPTRGALIPDFLNSDLGPKVFLENLHTKEKAPTLYNGFNLLLGDGEDLFWYSNRAGEVLKVEPGVHGLSNAFLDTPWPKVRAGKFYLKEHLKKGVNDEEMLNYMRNDEIYPDSELPKTNIPMEWERKLSALCIKSENYGTRLTTILKVEEEGGLQVLEKDIQTERTSAFEVKSQKRG